MKTAAYAIKAKNLTRRFGGKTAVSKVNLSIREGEIYGFLGPNGAGKSTTIKMLVTLLKPTSGSITVLGNNAIDNPDAVRLDIGVALQEAALDESQRGDEFLRLQAHLYGLHGEPMDERIAELEKLVDIGEAINDPIKTYSGGMKRRLDLAAALVHNPKVLFLDEPSNGLDPISRVKVWNEVRRLNEELGMTIFLTTQYLEEADQLADRIGIISNGELVVEGTPEDLKRKTGQDSILVICDEQPDSILKALRNIKGITKVDQSKGEILLTSNHGAEAIAPVAIELERLKVKIKQLTLRETSLDDVFLEYTGNRLSKQGDEA
ncbi:MAG: ATP-binding cassette domain-containing protein [bacterium]